MKKRKCKKIIYEALGVVHEAYCYKALNEKDIKKIITSICNTAIVKSIEKTEVTIEEFEDFNISKVKEWLKHFEPNEQRESA